MITFIHGTNTSDIRLVSALGAMGIECAKGAELSSAIRNPDGSIVRTWNLSDVSNCGKYQLKELLAWWRDKSFHINNPDHVFTKVKAAMNSGKNYAAALRQGQSIGSVAYGNSLVSNPSSLEIHQRISTLEVTDDFYLCSALLAMGVDVSPIQSNGMLKMMQIGRNGNPFKIQEFRIAWADANYHLVHSQNAFAYVKCAIENYKKLVNYVKGNKPHLVIKRGESVAYLHPDCSSETEGKVLSQFDK